MRFAFREGTIQNILHDEGYPTAKAYITCEDRDILGGEFMVMDFMRGKTMYEATTIDLIPTKLAEAHARLHGINPSRFIEKLKQSSVPQFSYDGTVYVDSWISSSNIDWLKPGLKWIMENQPTERRSAICHGDFHPNNILVEEGEVSAVLDWSSGRIGEPESDVAATRTILTCYSPSVRPWIDYVAFTDEYLDLYTKHERLDLERVRYYEAARSLKLLEALEAGFVSEMPGVRERFLSRFYDVSGLRLSK